MRRALLIALGGAGILIAGCGGGDEDSPAATSNAGAGRGRDARVGAARAPGRARPAARRDRLRAAGQPPDPRAARRAAEAPVRHLARAPRPRRLGPPVERLPRLGDPPAARRPVPGRHAAQRPGRARERRALAGEAVGERPAAAAGAVRRHAEAGPRPVHPRASGPQPRSRGLRRPQLGIVSPATIARIDAPGAGAFTASGSGTGPFELRERSGAGRAAGSKRRLVGDAARARAGASTRSSSRCSPARATGRGRSPTGGAQVATGLGRSEASDVRADPLLTRRAARGGGFIGLERSVRGIPAGDPFPSLNSVWLTRLASG